MQLNRGPLARPLPIRRNVNSEVGISTRANHHKKDINCLMPALDISTLVNWVVSGFIGLVFGVVSAWVTHRYQKERDSITWEREKEKLREQFEHEKILLELQFQQRLKELEQQSVQQQSGRVREEILKGVDNPDKAIEELQRARQRIYAPPAMPIMQSSRSPAPRARPASISLVIIVVIVVLALVICLVPILLQLLQR